MQDTVTPTREYTHSPVQESRNPPPRAGEEAEDRFKEWDTNPRLILSTCGEIPAGTEGSERKVQWTSLGT